MVLQFFDADAPKHAEVLGWSQASTSPLVPFAFVDPDSIGKAASAAVKSARLSPSDISLVHVHAMGSPASDIPEIEGINLALVHKQQLDTSKVVLANHKCNIGHTEYASGVIALITTLLIFENRQVPVHAAVEIPIEVIQRTPQLCLPITQPYELPAVTTLYSSISGTSATGDNVNVVLKTREHTMGQTSTENRDQSRLNRGLLTRVPDKLTSTIEATHVRQQHEMEESLERLVASAGQATGLLLDMDSVEQLIISHVERLVPHTVALEDPLLQIGFDSTKAVTLAQSLQQEFSIPELPRILVFLCPTVADIAAYIRSVKDTKVRSVDYKGLPYTQDGSCSADWILDDIQIADPMVAMPLSHSQEQMWALYEIDQSSQYNVSYVLEMQGIVHANSLQGSLVSICMKHQVLRHLYRYSEDGSPIQLMLSSYTPAHRALFVGDREWIQQHVNTENQSAVDLQMSGSLRSLSLVLLNPQLHCWVLTMHHVSFKYLLNPK